MVILENIAILTSPFKFTSFWKSLSTYCYLSKSLQEMRQRSGDFSTDIPGVCIIWHFIF